MRLIIYLLILLGFPHRKSYHMKNDSFVYLLLSLHLYLCGYFFNLCVLFLGSAHLLNINRDSSHPCLDSNHKEIILCFSRNYVAYSSFLFIQTS